MDFGYWFVLGWKIGIAGLGFIALMLAAFFAFMLVGWTVSLVVALLKKLLGVDNAEGGESE